MVKDSGSRQGLENDGILYVPARGYAADDLFRVSLVFRLFVIMHMNRYSELYKPHKRKQDMKRRLFALVLILALVLTLTACGGSSDAKSGKVSITIFNSKTEIQGRLEEAAAKYAEEKGVGIDTISQ